MIDLDAFRGVDGEIRFDAAGADGGYVLVGPDGTHVRLSASALHLLQAVRSGVGFEELARALGERRERAVSAAELRAAWERLEATLEAATAGERRRLPPGFWWRRPLLSERVVSRIASALSALFTPWLWPVGLLAFVAAAAWLHRAEGLAPLFGDAFWPAYGLFTLSLLVHELGHASACARFGARPSDVGLAVYLIYPAFYSDVTRAWRLPRWQRVVVDLGGAYFQILIGVVFTLAFAATGHLAFAAAVWMIVVSCLFSLNPVFRFDGYWVVADALGVTRLDREPTRLLRHLVDRLRGRSPRPLPWPAWVTAVLAFYAPLTFVVWAVFLWRLVPHLWSRALAYPRHLGAVLESVAAWAPPAGDDLRILLVSTFLLLISLLMTWRLLARAARLLAAPARRGSRAGGQSATSSRSPARARHS